MAVLALFAACKNPAGNDTDTYTVTFDKNHLDTTGYTEADPKTKTVTTPATTVGTLPTAPTRTGYDFVKWTANKDGFGPLFTATTKVTADIIVYAQWREEGVEPPENFTINLNKTGDVSGDSVTVSSEEGEAGDTITISYTLANDRKNNWLVFSGTQTSISQVTSAGTGTREYIVAAEDAINKTITINATFTHTDKNIDTIAFANNTINKTYGDDTFSITVSTTGSGTGAITYSSSDTSTATVNASTGQVTILKAGGCSITATKAADANYEGTKADYTLHIAKADGAAVTAPTLASKTHNTITVNAVSAPSTGQTVEYAISTSSTTPSSGWQSSTTFTELTPNTAYYVFARAIANDNYNQGAAQMSAAITTNAAPTPGELIPVQIVDFENDALGATTTYSVTSAPNNGSGTVTIVNDPIKSDEKSLSMNSTGYNIGAIVPINLPYELNSYKSFTFRFNPVNGSFTNKKILVYAAKSASTFVQYGFGNPANSEYAQFAANLLGEVQASTTTNQWQDFTITITNPGNAIKDLQGNIFLAIGINDNSNLTYLLDDITFIIKDGFEPPYVPPPPAAPAPASFPAAVSSGQYRNLFKERGKWTDAEIDAKVQAAWNQLLVNGTAEGDHAQKIYYEVAGDMAYILDSGNDDVRSEGMSYAMMMAVQMDDQVRFKKLWKWAHTYMYNDRTVKADDIRGYFSWQRSKTGASLGYNSNGPAPDGEFYFVTALLFASARWGDESGINEYGRWARYILYDMIHRDSGGLDNWGASTMFNTSNHLPLFTTRGASTGGASGHTDPSYILPAFYDIWAIEIENGTQYHDIWPNGSTGATADAAFYRAAATAGRNFFHTTVNATTGLGPDYANFNGSPTGGEHQDFRYDAWRIALNIGMDYSWWKIDTPWQVTQSDRIQSFFHSKGVETYGALWTLTGTVINNNTDHSPGLVACNAVASLAASQQITWDFIDDFWNISTTEGQYRYYDGCLYMMGLLHVSGKFKAYLSTGGGTPNPYISPTSAAFNKYTSSADYKDIAVTMTLNGSTLSNIKNGGTTLTQGSSNDYILSGSSVTIRKEYLATMSVGTTTLTFTFANGTTRTLSIDITNTAPTPTISPTSAIFDKKTSAQADVVVTMTLVGTTLSNIKNGGTTLTQGNNVYTVSGSTVTIKAEYLAGLANGNTTLIFTFSDGTTRNIVITIGDTTDGGTIGEGTEYDFANGANPSVTSSNVNVTIENGVLRVNGPSQNSNARQVMIPFNLGGSTLGSFTKLQLVVKCSGDYTYKDFTVAVSDNNGSTWTQIASTRTDSWTTAFKTIDINISGAAALSGSITLRLQWAQSGAVTYEFQSIKLVQ